MFKDILTEEQAERLRELLQLAVARADDKVEDMTNELMSRLKGRILNLFEMCITDKKQMEAIRRGLSDTLANVVSDRVPQKVREILLYVAKQLDSDVKFKERD